MLLMRRLPAGVVTGLRLQHQAHYLFTLSPVAKSSCNVHRRPSILRHRGGGKCVQLSQACRGFGPVGVHAMQCTI